MNKVALLCAGTTCPDKIFKEDIIVRVNLCKPRKDKRTDIWIFGDGYNYLAEREHFTGEFVGYSNCSGSGWFKPYPTSIFHRLKQSLKGFQPSAGLMALEYLLSLNYSNINVYGMDFYATGHYYDDDIIDLNVHMHDFKLEESYVNELMQKNKGVKIMAIKTAKNKAIQEPKEIKTVKKLDVKAKTIRCKVCEFIMLDTGVARGCPNCNSKVD